eukprot:scaffold2196_cov234-Pinguiococcus_pyrenoidosus.AAC.3
MSLVARQVLGCEAAKHREPVRRALAKEELHGMEVPLLRGIVKGCDVSIPLGVDVCSAAEQVLDDGFVASSGSQMQGSSAGFRRRVHVAAVLQQHEHHSLMTLEAGMMERPQSFGVSPLNVPTELQHEPHDVYVAAVASEK